MSDNYQNDLLRASVMIQAGRAHQARPILSRLVQENIDDEQAWFLLGMALETREQRIYAYRQVLRINPQNHDARRKLDELVASSSETAGPPGSRLRRLSSVEEEDADLDQVLSDPSLEVPAAAVDAAAEDAPQEEQAFEDAQPQTPVFVEGDDETETWGAFSGEESVYVPPFVGLDLDEDLAEPELEPQHLEEEDETEELPPVTFSTTEAAAGTAGVYDEPEEQAPAAAGLPEQPEAERKQPPAPQKKNGPRRGTAILGCLAAALLLLIVLAVGAYIFINNELPLLFPGGEVPPPFDRLFGLLPQ